MHVICEASALLEGGEGHRFMVGEGSGARAAFVVRFSGRVYAFANRCAHVPIELDWIPGRFFDDEGRYLICATHGALYEPTTGYCVAGPCRGARLERIAVIEADGMVIQEPV